MGGQACIWYGALQFSADIDIFVAADTDNIRRLAAAMLELSAVRVAVPPVDVFYLQKGHFVHYRVSAPGESPISVDVAASLRGLDHFEDLWRRRSSIHEDGTVVDLLSLTDLVQSKKSERDRDWPILTHLVEADYAVHRAEPAVAKVDFWLQESRTPGILIELATSFPARLAKWQSQRPLLRDAATQDESAVLAGLADEQRLESEADRAYWAPLKAELEQLRLQRRGN